MKPEVECVDSYTPEEFQKLPAWKRVQLMKEKEEREANQVNEQVGSSDAATKEQDDKEKYPNHGSEITACRNDEVTKERKCKKCFLPIGKTATECPNCGAMNPLERKSAPKSYAMGWFDFLIYFWLFASCVVWFLAALGFVGQAIGFDKMAKWYVEESNSFYGRFHDYTSDIAAAEYQRDWMIAMAIAGVIMGIWALVARSGLANYSLWGQSAFYSYLIGGIVFCIMYGIALSDGGISIYYWQLFTGVPATVVNVICLICNKIYFDKREELFC